jgi:hypothetical protein
MSRITGKFVQRKLKFSFDGDCFRMAGFRAKRKAHIGTWRITVMHHELFLADQNKNRFCFIERTMRSQLFSEISRRGRRRWLQVDEMPFSRAITYKLIDAGLISSVVVIWPGSRRGRRLIDGDSPLR